MVRAKRKLRWGAAVVLVGVALAALLIPRMVHHNGQGVGSPSGGMIASTTAPSHLDGTNVTGSDSPRADVNEFTTRLSESVVRSDAAKIAGSGFRLEGMTPTAEPEGYWNKTIRESAEGRYAAFVAFKLDDRSSRIIVQDRRTGTQCIVPAPEEKVYDCRSIRHLQWDEEGQSLYVVEDATDGVRTKGEWDALTSRERQMQVSQKDYEVLYSSDPGTKETRVLDRVKGRVLGVSPAKEGVWLVNETEGKPGFIDVRQYRGGQRVSLQTLPITLNGEFVDHLRPQILPKHNQLWFVTRQVKPGAARTRNWLAMVELDKPDRGSKLVEPDVYDFGWSPDQTRLYMQKIEAAGEPTSAEGKALTPAVRLSYILMRHDAMDRPVVFACKEDLLPNEHSPSFLSFSCDGQKAYFSALANKVLVEPIDLFKPGVQRIYELGLPK